MEQFWTQNQRFVIFLYNYFVDFSEIALNEEHLKVVKSDCFGILRQILIIPKIGADGNGTKSRNASHIDTYMITQ